MIEIRNLTKTYGTTTAVDDLTVTVHPGVVTGFLGPNGAGKSTTMRAIVGLDHPTSGEVLVNGRPYTEHPAPLQQVGALLDTQAVHPGRSGLAHLRALGAANGIGACRVAEVVEMVGLTDVAGHRAGGFSLGMGQRLGIAAALLGDPEVLVLDEPVNGLDLDGIRWIRGLLRGLAAEGRTVFVSSHLISEMALTADHLVILGRGRLLADVSMAEMTASASGQVLVRSPQADELGRLLAADGVTITAREPGTLSVTGRAAEEIARTALSFRILLTELTPVHASLEAYLAMTRHDLRYRATSSPGRGSRMTSTTAAGAPTSDLRVTPRRVMTSEWTKLRSLRSTFWTLLALTVSILGMGAFTALGIVVQDSLPASEAIAADRPAEPWPG